MSPAWGEKRVISTLISGWFQTGDIFSCWHISHDTLCSQLPPFPIRCHTLIIPWMEKKKIIKEARGEIIQQSLRKTEQGIPGRSSWQQRDQRTWKNRGNEGGVGCRGGSIIAPWRAADAVPKAPGARTAAAASPAVLAKSSGGNSRREGGREAGRESLALCLAPGSAISLPANEH